MFVSRRKYQKVIEENEQLRLMLADRQAAYDSLYRAGVAAMDRLGKATEKHMEEAYELGRVAGKQEALQEALRER